MNFLSGKKFMDKRLEKLNRALAGQCLGRPLLWFDKVGSTNDILKEKAAAGAPEGSTIIADEQTRGRGQRGKDWLSLAGKGVYMSLLLRPGRRAAEADLLSMFVAVGVAQGLEALGIGQVRVKWPNDVLARGKKIAGILVEPRISRHGLEFAVIGIGINVRHGKADLAPLGNGATSCRLEGVHAGCDQVFIRVLRELESCYALLRRNQEQRILEAWTRRRIEVAPDAQRAIGATVIMHQAARS